MGGRSLSDDTVGMSESIGVGVLIFLTIFVTAIVGLNVLVVEDDSGSGPQANFTYDYVSENELLLVTYSRGDPLEAGKIEFEGPSKRVTWARLANRNNTSMVEPGDIAQLSSGNAYGRRVSARDTVEIYYNRSGNRTKLDEWSGG
ncbi:type IV pilin [Haloarcula sp. JP-L23]|uniref:type IV pilin n=1 Tax=Haloarcula sp. JP-L23 TaxID=2716717 RepID=UPI00140EB674|nr:type IV pilin [Haloarcula sp. JP-L23]